MDDPLDPPTHAPDPAKRYTVLGFTRGAQIYIEIFDEVEKRSLVVPFPEALTLAADINLAVAHVFSELAAYLDREDGTIPGWERQISEWKKKGTGTEGLN